MTLSLVEWQQIEGIITELLNSENDASNTASGVADSIAEMKEILRMDCIRKYIQVDCQADEDYTASLDSLFQKAQGKRIAIMAILGLDLSIEQLEPLESVLPILGENRFCLAVDSELGTSIRLLIGVFKDQMK